MFDIGDGQIRLNFGNNQREQQRKGGIFILIIKFGNFGGRRKNISNIEICIVNCLVGKLWPVGFVMVSEDVMIWRLGITIDQYPRQLSRNFWKSCHWCRVQAVGLIFIVGPIKRLATLVSKHKTLRFTGLASQRRNMCNDGVWSWELIKPMSFNGKSGNKTEEIVGALDVAGRT
jgi:hypothetical protein